MLQKRYFRLFRVKIYSTNILSNIYYFAVSSSFHGEHNKVIKGIYYFLAGKSPYSSEYSLRRNIHRIEKGLVMKPPRNLFAVDYIDETVENYYKLSEPGFAELSELLDWAYDIISCYFESTNVDPLTNHARAKFNEINPRTHKGKKKVPYFRIQSPVNTIAYEQFLLLAQRRRSVRWYTSAPVPRELIDKAIAIADLSPSACNRQPFEYRVYDAYEKVRVLLDIPGGTSGWGHTPPVVIVLVGHLRAFSEERDRHLIYIDSSLAAMSLMLGLETLGLSSCAINFPDIAEKNMRISTVLGLEPDEVVIMLISVGYAEEKGLIPYSQKKGINSIRSYNK